MWKHSACAIRLSGLTAVKTDIKKMQNQWQTYGLLLNSLVYHSSKVQNRVMSNRKKRYALVPGREFPHFLTNKKNPKWAISWRAALCCKFGSKLKEEISKFRINVHDLSVNAMNSHCQCFREIAYGETIEYQESQSNIVNESTYIFVMFLL